MEKTCRVTDAYAGNKRIEALIDTSKLHYVKAPENHIVIDFDIRDESGRGLYNGAHLDAFTHTYASNNYSYDDI